MALGQKSDNELALEAIEQGRHDREQRLQREAAAQEDAQRQQAIAQAQTISAELTATWAAYETLLREFDAHFSQALIALRSLAREQAHISTLRDQRLQLCLRARIPVDGDARSLRDLPALAMNRLKATWLRGMRE